MTCFGVRNLILDYIRSAVRLGPAMKLPVIQANAEKLRDELTFA